MKNNYTGAETNLKAEAYVFAADGQTSLDCRGRKDGGGGAGIVSDDGGRDLARRRKCGQICRLVTADRAGMRDAA